MEHHGERIGDVVRCGPPFVSLTCSIVCIGEVGAIFRTANISTPKRSSRFSFFQSWEINVELKPSVFKWIREVSIINSIVV